jgi:hypothetical protein
MSLSTSSALPHPASPSAPLPLLRATSRVASPSCPGAVDDSNCRQSHDSDRKLKTPALSTLLWHLRQASLFLRKNSDSF